jgi:hypothetical protein
MSKEKSDEDFSDVPRKTDLINKLTYVIGYIEEGQSMIQFAGVPDDRIEKVIGDMQKGFVNIGIPGSEHFYKIKISTAKIYTDGSFSEIHKEGY